jgi:hypothetical protein
MENSLNCMTTSTMPRIMVKAIIAIVTNAPNASTAHLQHLRALAELLHPKLLGEAPLIIHRRTQKNSGRSFMK